MTTRDLALTGELAVTPQEIVENASNQARVLMDIVEKTHCFQLISKKKYLQVEAWETIGRFNGIHAVTEWVNPIIRDGITAGYDAKVNLIDQRGCVVGSAIMPCYFTENACKGKDGDAKDKAAKSAAQTFATSKAYRMNYSYIAILAGYEPLPAEEITGEDTLGGVKQERKDHFCYEHNTEYFKKGNMRGYAHPIEGTEPTQWCSEPPSEPPTSTPETQARDRVTAVTDEVLPNGINITYLKGALHELQWADVGKYLKDRYNATGSSISERVAKLTRPQAEEFIKEIEERLQKK